MKIRRRKAGLLHIRFAKLDVDSENAYAARPFKRERSKWLYGLHPSILDGDSRMENLNRFLFLGKALLNEERA